MDREADAMIAHVFIGQACDDGRSRYRRAAHAAGQRPLSEEHFPECRKHPSQFGAMVKEWRESEEQIIVTTHHPYLLDHFQPDEVTLCTYNPDRSLRLTSLDCENVRSDLGIFHLGEIWSGDDDLLLALIERER